MGAPEVEEAGDLPVYVSSDFELVKHETFDLRREIATGDVYVVLEYDREIVLFYGLRWLDSANRLIQYAHAGDLAKGRPIVATGLASQGVVRMIGGTPYGYLV